MAKFAHGVERRTRRILGARAVRDSMHFCALLLTPDCAPCDGAPSMVAAKRGSRLFYIGLVLIGLLHMDARSASAQSCAVCTGVCGDITTGFGSCFLSGTLCLCTTGGVCGPPICSTTACPPGLACNQTTCMCEAGVPTPTATATATATP